MNKANGLKSNDFLFFTLSSGGGVRPHRHPPGYGPDFRSFFFFDGIVHFARGAGPLPQFLV